MIAFYADTKQPESSRLQHMRSHITNKSNFRDSGPSIDYQTYHRVACFLAKKGSDGFWLRHLIGMIKLIEQTKSGELIEKYKFCKLDDDILVRNRSPIFCTAG